METTNHYGMKPKIPPWPSPDDDFAEPQLLLAAGQLRGLVPEALQLRGGDLHLLDEAKPVVGESELSDLELFRNNKVC